MLSVTRLRMLSHSLLNVSCQKQRRSTWTLCPREAAPMELAVVQPRTNFGPAHLLGVPGPGFSSLDSDDDDDCEVVIGIKPKSSPLPRRKTSEEEEEEEEEAHLSRGSRRVCFADAKGLCLVLVKEFESWDVPKLPGGYNQRRAEGQDAERYSYYLSFQSPLPMPPEELGSRVREQKIELESIELLPGTTVLRGLVRVLNVSFDKTVFVRTTLNAWASHFDLLAEYIQGSSDGVTDCFSFKLTLVPPFAERGARVDFCLRYETPVGTFWANNGAMNYVLFCHQRVKEGGETPQEVECIRRKSCLKAARQHFTTVDNSSLEENLQTIQNGMPGVSKNGEALNMKSRQVTDSHSAASEEDCHKLTMEGGRNACRRSRRRRAARQAKAKDLLSQRDHKPEAQREGVGASLPDPPSDSRVTECENLAESTLDSRSHSDGPSAAGVRRYASSPVQSGETSKAETSESTDLVDQPVQPVGAEGRATPSRQPHVEEKLQQKQRSAASVTGDNGQRPLESMGDDPGSDPGGDNVCIINNTGEESSSDVSLAERTEAPVTTPSRFTFGTVVAPLYPLVRGQVKSENRNLADQFNPTRERSLTGDSLENCAYSIPADSTGIDEDMSRVSRELLKSHDRKSINTRLNDVPREDGESCVKSVAADTSPSHADIDCQESEQECTGTSNNPQPPADEDATPSDVNSELLNACAARVGLNLPGKAVEGPQALGCQWKNLKSEKLTAADADAAEAPTEQAEQVFSDIQMHLNPTQAVLRDTTDATSPQPRLSPFGSACEDQHMVQQICCDAPTGVICTDESNELDGVQPTVTVSTTDMHLKKGREVERLEELDPACLMCSVLVFEAPDVSAGDQSIPEPKEHRCCAVDLSQETLKTSPEVVEELDNGGVESTNNLEEGDTTPTVGHEDSVYVSECIKFKRHSCTHPDMLGKEIGLALVEKPVCMPAEADRNAIEAAAAKQDSVMSYEVRTEDKNWEMMVEEEEEDALDEEVMTKEVQREKDELKQEQTITGQQPLEKTVSMCCLFSQLTELEGQKHFCATGEKSKVELGTVKEPLVLEEQEVEEEKVNNDADHGTDNQHDVWETIRKEEKENLAKTDTETQVQVEDKAERISVDEEERSVSGAGEGGMAVEAVEESAVGAAKEEMDEETERPETRPHASQNKADSDPSTPVSNVHEGEVERVIDKENSPENETSCFPNEMHFISEEERQSNTYSLHLASGQSKALSESARCGIDSSTSQKGSLVFTDEPECDPVGEEEEEEEEDSSSSESPSDEEMELYMHRLRAAPSPQTLRSFPRDGGLEKGSHTGKRLSIDRPKLLPSSMPPISEAANEEPLIRIPDTPEEVDVENFQAESAPFPTQDNQEYGGVNPAQLTDAFSCSNILRSLVYVTMFVVFVVVAYHYDFLACFVLYLLSILWLYCQADKRPVKNNNVLN